MRRTAIPYKDAIQWIVENDDTEWLDPAEGEAGNPSVTTCLVADIYGRTVEEVTLDLRRAAAR